MINLLEDHSNQLIHCNQVMSRCLQITLLFILLIAQPHLAQKMNVQTFNMRDGLSQMKVSCLFEDSRGYIWIGTRNGLNRFNGATFQIFTTEDGLLNNRIHGIRERPDGSIVIVSAGGVSIFNGMDFENYVHSFPRVLYNVGQDDTGHLYIFSSNLYSFHPSTGIVKLYDEIYHFGMDNLSQAFIGIAEDSVFQLENGLIKTRNIFNSSNNNSWTGPLASELVVSQNPQQPDSFYTYNLEQNKWESTGTTGNLPSKPTLIDHCWHDSLILSNGKASKLPFKGGFCMIKSKANNYFIGTDEGLVRYFPSAFQEVPIENLPYVWSIIDAKESLFFGNYGHGLIEMNKSTGEFKKRKNDFALYHCGSSTNGQGTFYFSNNQGLIQLKNDTLDIISLESPVLYNIYDKSRNAVVMGVNNGIALLNSEGHVTFHNNKGLFHENHYIQNITMGPDHAYWCGSYTGLTRYNPDDSTAVHFTQDMNNLPVGPGVFCGLIDSKNRLWFGGSSGLCWYDSNQNKLIKIKTPVLNNQIKSIIEVSPGVLLLGSKNELLTFKSQDYFDHQEVDVDFYNAHNGYNGIEPGYTGLYRDAEKNIWITSASHTSILTYPYQLKENSVLKTQIVSIDGKNVAIRKHSDSISLHNNKNILIEVEAVGLDRPSNIRYAIKVNEEKWSAWQDESQFMLDHLPHGHNLIEVASGPDLNNPELLARAHVLVSLPLIQRDFFLPMLIAILGLIIGYTLYLLWKRRVERQAFLMQVEESRYLRSQLLLSELNPHFIFNVLASIQNKILKGDKEEANNKLVQLSSLIRNFLHVSFKSNDPKNKLEHEIVLDREIELLRSYLEFEQSNSNNHFEYRINIDETCIPTQVMIPPMLIQPFVENAVKHGVLPKKEKGLIELHFRYQENALFCEILDDGVGIRYSQQQAKNPARVSLGSTIVKERISALNQIGYRIDVEIVDREPHGTSVKIKIQE